MYYESEFIFSQSSSFLNHMVYLSKVILTEYSWTYFLMMIINFLYFKP